MNGRTCALLLALSAVSMVAAGAVAQDLGVDGYSHVSIYRYEVVPSRFSLEWANLSLAGPRAVVNVELANQDAVAHSASVSVSLLLPNGTEFARKSTTTGPVAAGGTWFGSFKMIFPFNSSFISADVVEIQDLT